MKNRDTERPGITEISPPIELAPGTIGDGPEKPYVDMPYAPASLQVAYHGGPPDLTYRGRLWYRGKPQSVTESEWSAMRARADFAHFDFRVQ